jgi:hypothetical protein
MKMKLKNYDATTAVAEHCRKLRKMAENGRKWSKIVENGRKMLETATDGRKWWIRRKNPSGDYRNIIIFLRDQCEIVSIRFAVTVGSSVRR